MKEHTHHHKRWLMLAVVAWLTALAFFLWTTAISKADELNVWKKLLVSPTEELQYEIKFAEPAVFQSLTFGKTMRWGIDFLVNQKAAHERELLYMYRVSEMTPESYSSVVKAMSDISNQKNRRFALVRDLSPLVVLGFNPEKVKVLGGIYGYVGVPVDWNKEIADSLRALASAETDAAISEKILAGYNDLIARQVSEKARAFLEEAGFGQLYLATSKRIDDPMLKPIRIVGDAPAWPAAD